jgi:hypothetical protein
MHGEQPGAEQPGADTLPDEPPADRGEPAPPTERRDGGPRSEPSCASAELARSRRMAEVFGEVLPEDTADDRPDRGRGGDERWYLENRPPHHGG